MATSNSRHKTFRTAAVKLEILKKYNTLAKMRERATTEQRKQIETKILQLSQEYNIKPGSLPATMFKWNKAKEKLRETVRDRGGDAKSNRKRKTEPQIQGLSGMPSTHSMMVFPFSRKPSKIT